MSIPVITVAQMRDWEKATWASGQTEAEVIRLVGRRVAQRALQLTYSGDLILILAGKDHNGEDARAGRELLKDRRVEVLEVKEPAADLPRLKSVLSAGPALVVDGLFGIGLNRSLSAEWVQFIDTLNGASTKVLAVDVPSGLDADTGETFGTAVRAAVTLTVGAPKLGMIQEKASSYVGRLEVATDIGLSPVSVTSPVQWTTREDFSNFPAPRPVSSHKGTYGHLAIIAGSLGFHGAAVLAARGAQRAQPGLITLYALEQVYHVIASQLQAVMVAPWQPTHKFNAPRTAVLMGPGLAAPGLPDELKLLLRIMWRDSEQPVIVDASALDWVPLETPRRDAIRVLTPHPGEAARLLRATTQEVQANRVDSVRKISERYGNAWVVLKGHQTLIGRSSGEVFVNPSGNAYMAQGGTGDLLSGYIAGFLAQPACAADVLRTLRYAVWQHGMAADALQVSAPNWVVEDLIPQLGRQL